MTPGAIRRIHRLMAEAAASDDDEAWVRLFAQLVKEGAIDPGIVWWWISHGRVGDA